MKIIGRLVLYDDFVTDPEQERWVGIFVYADYGCALILHENVHDWLLPFHGFYVKLRREKE